MRKVSRWIVASLALWLSACSTLLKTAEQVPWSPVTLNTAKEVDLLDVTFTQQTGWLVGSGTTLLKSTDGGKTWLPPFNKPLMGKANDQGEAQPLAARFLSVSFTEDGKEGWLAGEPRILLHTEDSGKSWFAISLNKRIEGTPILVTSLGTGVAEIVTNVGSVFKTEDAGKVWRAVTPTSAGGIRAVERMGDGSYWAVSTRGATYLRWQPGDGQWKDMPHTSTPKRIQNLVFVNDSYGLLLNNAGEMEITIDGGKTWSKPNTPDIASAITMLDAGLDEKGRLWVAGGNGSLLVTADQGKTWEKAPLDSKSTFYRVKFTGGQGFVMGQRGTLFRYQAP